jgi:hypothetical protein
MSASDVSFKIKNSIRYEKPLEIVVGLFVLIQLMLSLDSENTDQALMILLQLSYQRRHRHGNFLQPLRLVSHLKKLTILMLSMQHIVILKRRKHDAKSLLDSLHKNSRNTDKNFLWTFFRRISVIFMRLDLRYEKCESQVNSMQKP